MANRLKELIKAKGIKQVDIAKLLGVKPNTVSGWVHESRQMDHQTLVKLAEYFDVSIDYILKRDEAAPENEKAPDTAEAVSEAEEKISMEQTRQLLVRLGFLEEGRELTEQDLALVNHVIGILDAHFGQ